MYEYEIGIKKFIKNFNVAVFNALMLVNLELIVFSVHLLE